MTKLVQISEPLVEELWLEIKNARDEAVMAQAREKRLDDLLGRMQLEGMADHLPSLEEVQAIFRKG